MISILGLLCASTACAAIACADGTETAAPKTGVTVINSFDTWDDLKELEIEKSLFYGSLSVNRDEAYIAEGRASAKYYVEKVGANNPSFKMLATPKSDITDVTEFGLCIFNDNDYEFSVIINALDGSDGVIYTKHETVKVGGNELTFAVDRQMLQTTGSSVAKYQISFNGVKAQSTVYLDGFHAKTTTEKVETDAAVQAVVDTISTLNSSDRETVEAAMAEYKALDFSKQKAVHNYQLLKSAMDAFWLNDLTAAKADNPYTLLFFDEPFAEVQISGVSSSISACEYTKDFKYGDESGSLKVAFTPSSTNWVTVSTTATVPIDDGYIKLHIYNDSMQEKVLCIGWNGPTGANSMWNIKAKSWLDIVCPSTYLTANKGGIQIAGYDNGRGVAPEGELYFSAVTTLDYDREFNSMRTGGDENTLLFFDREAGDAQISNVGTAGTTYGYTAEKAYGGESGSLKVSFPGTAAQNTVGYSFYGYPFKANDYVVFYIYNDTTCDFLSLLFGYENGVRLAKGEWTMVVRPASEIADKYWRFMGQQYVSANGVEKASQTQTNVSGSIYVSKAKVYAADKIVALTGASATTEWTVGETTFVGAPSKYNGEANNLMNNLLEYDPYVINGEVRMTVWGSTAGSGDYAGFYAKLKTAYDVSTANGYVAVTLKGAITEKFTILPMDERGEWGAYTGALKPIATVAGEDGYATCVFEVPATAGKTISGLRITPVGGTRTKGTNGNYVPTAEAFEVRISDILIGDEAAMIAKGYLAEN